jgi:transcriptional regulator with PAS, ATPase and Fis domain
MSAPRERTQTALLSAFGRGGDATVALLIPAGRADRVQATGKLAPLADALQIGRGAGSSPGALLLDDPLVSGQHARLARTPEGYQLTDVGSKNGTFLGEQRLEAPVLLDDGARLFIGNHALVFRIVPVTDLAALDEERATPLGPVATSSPILARVCHKLRRLATTEAELLLAGETGVGKEVYARAVHAASGRAGPFAAVNCAALPRDLVESELFGYRPGAHSTAHAAKAGLVEEAEGGTLFLDEIGEMPLAAQSKLLRFLQDRELVPLGGTRPRRLDVRVIAATNRPVAAGSEAGLRDDLLARLGAAPLTLPPLRERIEDLGALVAHFARGVTEPRFELPAFRALVLHGWPLNVRELQKVLSAAFALSEGLRPVALRDLPDTLGSTPAATARPAARKSPEPAPSAAELEALLVQHGGRVADVSRALGRQRAAVWRWIKQLGLDPDRYRSQK